MDRVQKKWSCVPSEIQTLQEELGVLIQEAKDKVLPFLSILIRIFIICVVCLPFTTRRSKNDDRIKHSFVCFSLGWLWKRVVRFTKWASR